MKKNLMIAVLFTLVTTVLFGVIYPLGCNRTFASLVARSGQWAIDRKGRQSGRIETNRASLYRPGLFPFAAVRSRHGVRPYGKRRIEPRADK